MTELSKYTTLDLVEEPQLEPLTLSEIKLYLRIDGNHEDDMLMTMLKSSRYAAEEYMNNSIVKRKLKLTFFDFMPKEVRLLKGPVTNLVSISIIDSKDNKTAIPESRYSLKGKHTLSCDAPINGTKIEVIYEAGFSNISTDIPEIIKQGLLSQIAYVYENRGTGNHALDNSARALFNFYRNIYL